MGKYQYLHRDSTKYQCMDMFRPQQDSTKYQYMDMVRAMQDSTKYQCMDMVRAKQLHFKEEMKATQLSGSLINSLNVNIYLSPISFN
jgi:hypothetical protein